MIAPPGLHLSVAIGSILALIAATLVAQAIARLNYPLPAADRRIGCVDGLRGYLALAVLLHHFVIWTGVERLGQAWAPPATNVYNQLGAGGVGLFFMTTGLVFYPRILKGWRATGWAATYIARVFRIVPLVCVSVVVITAIIMARTGRGFDAGYPVAAAKWVATMGEPPLLGYPDSGRLNAYVLWSLRYEWIFYVAVLPVCAVLSDLIRGRLPNWTLPVTLLAMTFAVRLAGWSTPLLTYLPLFFVGMLAHEVRSRAGLSAMLATRTAAIVSVTALAIGMVGMSTPFGWALPLFGLFFTAVACGNDLMGVLRTRGALVLGEASYGIYLIHGTVLNVLFVDLAPVIAPVPTWLLPILIPVAAMVTVAIAAATFVGIERPAIAIGRIIAARWTSQRLRPDAPSFDVAP